MAEKRCGCTTWEKRPFQWCFGPRWDSVAETVWPGSQSLPLQKRLNTMRQARRSGLLLRLAEWKMTLTIMLKFEDRDFSCEWEVQETKAKTRKIVPWKRNKMKCTPNLEAVVLAVNLHVPVAADLSSKAVQPLPPTLAERRKSQTLQCGSPCAAWWKLRTVFVILSTAMKTVCMQFDTDFR